MIFTGNILRLTVAELVAYGVPERSVWQGLWRHRDTGTSSWSYVDDPTDKRRALINYETIPGTTIRKYGIPPV